MGALLGAAYGSGRASEDHEAAAPSQAAPPGGDGAAPSEAGVQMPGADSPMTDAAEGGAIGDADQGLLLQAAEAEDDELLAILPEELREPVDAPCNPKLVVRLKSWNLKANRHAL